MHPLLRTPRKVIASRLGCSVGYVSAMYHAGLAESATPDDARAWLLANPDFRKRTAYPIREHKGSDGNAREHIAQ